MPDINQAVQDLVKAAKKLDDARKEEDAAEKDEKAKLAAMKKASDDVMKAKGKEATEAAGRVSHQAFKDWQDANTRRKKAAVERMIAEKKCREKMKAVQDAMWKLVWP